MAKKKRGTRGQTSPAAGDAQAAGGTLSAKERRAILRQQQSRRAQQRYILMGAGALLIVLVLGFAVYQNTLALPGESVASQGHMHIPEGTESPIPYNTTPPTSGPHYGSLAHWGIHDDPIPDPLQVHNLEDGGVMVQYDCPEGCPELVDQLAEIVSRYPRFVILAPYPGIGNRIALTAWTRIDKFDEFDEARIVRFIEAYHGVDRHPGR